MYVVGQVIKGKVPPSECPEGTYWRKQQGRDEFKLYERKERQSSGLRGAALEEGPRLTQARVAAGIRFYMQNEQGFKEVMALADLSAKALQNLMNWSSALATVKVEQERVKTQALAKAKDALKEAGLTIGPDGSLQPIVAG